MPIIDRNLPPDRLRKKRNHSSKTIVFAMIVVAVLMLGAITGLMVLVSKNRGGHYSETPARTPAGILLTTHLPILINGNSGFTFANGVSGGNGTASNPYIIANWAINASHADGISISDTNAHFIVRNCYIHDGWFGTSLVYYFGMLLSNCVNGTLENNTCTKDGYGMWLDTSSHGNAIINNSCSSNHFEGITLVSSSDNMVINNNCSATNSDGIDLYLSNNNTLSNNICSSSNGGFGISLGTSSNNRVMNNTCSSNYFHGIYLLSSSANILSKNICNSNGHWGLFLSASSGNTLVNNTCNGNYYDDILLSSSSDNSLRGNNCSNGGDTGINLRTSSNNNEISENQIWHSVGYGVYIYSGSDNRIWNNTFIGNDGATDIYNGSHVQALDDGTSNSWNSTDGYGNWWNDWQTPDNVPPFGIVDLPYNISGTVGAKDNFPLTTYQAPIPEFGMMPFVVMALMAVIVLAGETRRRKES